MRPETAALPLISDSAVSDDLAGFFLAWRRGQQLARLDKHAGILFLGFSTDDEAAVQRTRSAEHLCFNRRVQEEEHQHLNMRQAGVLTDVRQLLSQVGQWWEVVPSTQEMIGR
jgi:hypothetical protein